MRKIALVLLTFLFLGALRASAQVPSGQTVREPRLDIAGGYSYMRAHTVAPASFNMNGGSLSAAFNVNRWLGFVGDFGGYHTNNVKLSGFSLTLTSYLFGPRLSYRKNRAVTPFVQELVGAAHATGTLYTVGFAASGSTPGPATSFAMATGGGLDINLSSSWAIRAFQAEWLFSTLPNGASNRQHNLRVTTGLVWRIGGNTEK